MKVTLDWFEVAACAEAGLRRRIESIRKGLKPAKGFDLHAQIWDVDIQGACGEMAFAKALGLYWNGVVNNFHGGDVGRVQVRTARKADGPLYVQSYNDPADTFVLVRGVAPDFEVSGWMLGQEAMQKKYLKSHHGRVPVYTVPASDMHPLETLDAVHQASRPKQVRPGKPGRSHSLGR